MNYTCNEAPLIQESFEIGTADPDDIVIPGKDTRFGILYFQSGIPTFRQTAMPANITNEKVYHRNGKAYSEKTHTILFRGDNLDGTEGETIYCPCCNSVLAENGTIKNRIRHLPIGDNYTTLEVTRRRVRCLKPGCRYFYDFPIEFKAPSHFITLQLLNFTEDLLAMHYPLKTVAKITGLNKNTVKAIDKARLDNRYTVNGEGKVLKNPASRARFLAVDEFKLHDGHKYATVIIDLENGHILHIAHGRKKAVIYEFIDRVGLDWMSSVQAVACDMNSDFEEAFRERCPHLRIVFDYFHLVKNYNDKVVSEVRKDEQARLKEEGREAEAKALKNTKYILMSSKETLERKEKEAAEGKLVSKGSELFNMPEKRSRGGQKARYEKLIRENELFLAMDIVKEKLKCAYTLRDTEQMRVAILDIIDTCRATGNDHFCRFAKMLESHFDGIISHARYPIGTSRLEGFNNAIKAERRQGYGYPDDEYFFLRLIDRSHMRDSLN